VVGTTQSITVTALDPYGNVATSYSGTVVLTSTDARASFLPSSYTFTAADRGAHTFRVTFQTIGSQTVTATDSGAKFSIQSGSTSVVPGIPTALTATAISSSQILLKWAGATGATGYSIQRRSATSASWITVGSTSAGTTSFVDSGLSARTTYFYRIQSLGGSGSAFSALALATTSAATVTPSITSLWDNSYSPFEDAYAFGNYELGLKFSSTVAGSVTGIRFYKEPWMNGPLHVGHLWSSTGALLATATFTDESLFGWQQVNFSSPVTISANTTYTVSFSTGGGFFGITTEEFRSASSNGTLNIPVNAGVYGPGDSFPTTNGYGMNFWVDVTFRPATTPQAVVSNSTSSTNTGIAVLTSGTTSNSSTESKTTQTAAPRDTVASTSTGSYPYRRTVNQSPAFSGSFSKRS
jgi:hypothetical protein